MCRAARQLDTLTKEVAVPLGKYMKGFPEVSKLHPFEQALLELTLGAGTYENTLARVNTLRKSVLEVRSFPCRLGPCLGL
jgi:nucleolar GTP-binding protein